MSFLDQLGQGLAVVQREAAKHITAENINRAAEEIRRHVDNAAQQHATLENMNRAGEEIRKHVDYAAQQIQEHVTPENMNRASEEVQKALDNAVRFVGEAAENARPHVEEAITSLKDTASHVEEWTKDEKNIEAVKNAAQTANFAKENPGLVAGLFMMVAPGIITAPVMGVARVLGFTSGGIAANSIASGAQSAAGNVAAKGAFATVQSAAAGGYGSGVLAGVVRVAGGAIAGLGGIGRGLMNWLGGGRQYPPPRREEH
ncbi:hypothetical protein M441DRAFT_27459 [Trichoderma asperellum CBS 433.97]|uniref:Uncharacterized protein n=1 Tax=Trichoderma asperellum (strain ATCC 204424 / CBS 433.97 / NBRC 101777) TaxID=1042311 RepID=A0A2T3Z814_TRIA4|nr:hypothetical protein M441DRAFT_27459 [Trichoderma asperellum CBS 433.97]PTB40949.1 hypothetical protein M441DRAFT_27459 [Trichoderma asperellum CBS 433.97]